MHEAEESLQELQQLAETAGIEVVYETIQSRNAPNPTYFIGEGKVEELKPLVEELDADAIIFDEELSPAQNRNLEKALMSPQLTGQDSFFRFLPNGHSPKKHAYK
ncbi:GTPase HflX [Geodia barretti]|uniref:GTPase HflX n=1 Tax=Geodia barretti TaxID=519541 RepID=A0AA35RUG0_GEOBA|nr:GTPase HflX [Geodia barretti]